jgi:hypothetical protein
MKDTSVREVNGLLIAQGQTTCLKQVDEFD